MDSLWLMDTGMETHREQRAKKSDVALADCVEKRLSCVDFDYTTNSNAITSNPLLLCVVHRFEDLHDAKTPCVTRKSMYNAQEKRI